MNDIRFYIAVLKSEECQCGKPKKSRMALCYDCYSSLPKDTQKTLWKKIRNGFEEAYDNALRWLNEYK